MKYKIFTRNWWKENPAWPNGLEPDSTARKNTIGYADTETEARQKCASYNSTHKSGRLSKKAEYTQI